MEVLRWKGSYLEVLDQRVLPAEERWLVLRKPSDVAHAIRAMVVRGAPLIGIVGAFGAAMAAMVARSEEELRGYWAELRGTRPTARNLFWAMERVEAAWKEEGARGARREAEQIWEEEREKCYRIARFGAELIGPEQVVVTICNTGRLATGGLGTALGAVFWAHREGKRVQVVALETRPRQQGARLTAWECVREGVPVVVIPDGACAAALRRFPGALVMVGADRVARNGDFANKIGTRTLMLVARAEGVERWVLFPESTLDLECASGEQIPVEVRAEEEVRRCGRETVVPKEAEVWNPAFDVTPAAWVSGYVTEEGIFPREKFLMRGGEKRA